MPEMNKKQKRNRSLFFYVGENEEFKTIQSAIDEAWKYGGGTIYLEPGHFYEDLILCSGITLEGCGIADLKFVSIHGKHLLPYHGEVAFNHIYLSNSSSIFKPTSTNNELSLLFRSCFFEVEDGYLLDIPELRGSVIFFDCCSTGNNNGFINNVDGKLKSTLFNITIDSKFKKNKMILSDNSLIFNAHITVIVEFSGMSNVVTVNGGSWIEDTLYLMNGATVKMSCSTIETGHNPFCFIAENSLLTLDNCLVDSSAEEIIVGSGSLRFGSVSFPSRTAISPLIKVQKSADFFKTSKKVGKKGDAKILPSAPVGYLVININGSEYMVPYYNKPIEI